MVKCCASTIQHLCIILGMLSTHFKFVLLCFIIFFSFSKIQAQKKTFSLLGGVGTQDAIHGGLEYQFHESFKSGISLGWYEETLDEEDNVDFFSVRTYSLNNYYLISSSKKFDGLGTWYIKQNLSLSREDEFDYFLNTYWIGLQVGRSFNFSEQLGLNVELGSMHSFSSTQSNGREYTGNNGFFPLIQFQFFAKILQL